MNMNKLINGLFRSRDIRLKILDMLRFIPDETMIRLEYRIKMGKKLNLASPVTFNEKIQWLKLNDRKSIYTQMVDKYGARDFVKKRIGGEYLIPSYGVWDSVDEIPFDNLPNSFVLKCTHDSGSVIICKDKSALDIEYAKRKLNKRLKKNAFWWGREWPYKGVKPRIIAEKYMAELDETSNNPLINSTMKSLFSYLSNDAQVEIKALDYLTNNLEKVEFQRLNLEQFDKRKEISVHFQEMIEKSKQLSEGIEFICEYYYEIGNNMYLGELVFSHETSLNHVNSIENVVAKIFEFELIKLDKLIKLPESIGGGVFNSYFKLCSMVA